MATLKFKLSEAKRLLDHSKQSSEHMTEYGEPTGVGLLWVKDSGTYLMSTGLPMLPFPENVTYAAGLGPDADYDDLVGACGGDDFAEYLGKDINDFIEKAWALPAYRENGILNIRVFRDRFDISITLCEGRGIVGAKA
jgi:hypothetical protein